MPGNDLSLDIRHLGAEAGKAKGFEDVSVQFADTMEERRKQRSERMMHIEKLSLGVEELMQRERLAREESRLAREQMAGIELRDIRGHRERERLQNLSFIQQDDMAIRAEKAALDLQNDRIAHDERSAETLLGHREGEGDLDRKSREKIAEMRAGERGGGGIGTGSRRAAEQSLKDNLAEQEIEDSIKLFARRTIFSDSDGNLDLNALRKRSEASGMSMQEIIEQYRREWAQTMGSMQQFKGKDLLNMASYEAFDLYTLSLVQDNADAERKGREALNLGIKHNKAITENAQSESLASDLATSSTAVRMRFDPAADKIEFTGPMAAQLTSFVDGIDITRPESERAAKLAELMVSGGVPKTMKEKYAQEIDFAFFVNTGKMSKMAGVPMSLNVLKATKTRLSGHIEGEPPERSERVIGASLVAGAMGRYTEVLTEFEEAEKNDDMGAMAEVAQLVYELDASLDGPTSAATDMVRVNVAKLRNDVASALGHKIIPRSPEEQAAEEEVRLSPGLAAIGETAKPAKLSKATRTESVDAAGKTWQTSELQNIARAQAIAHGIPEDGYKALIHAESAWDPQAGSHAGAKGLAQFMDPTAKEEGVDSSDVNSSLRGGAKYLAKLRKQTDSWEEAIAAYNWGIGNVKKFKKANGGEFPVDKIVNKGKDPNETRNYVNKLAPYFKGDKTYENLMPGAPEAADPMQAGTIIPKGADWQGVRQRTGGRLSQEQIDAAIEKQWPGNTKTPEGIREFIDNLGLGTDGDGFPDDTRVPLSELPPAPRTEDEKQAARAASEQASAADTSSRDPIVEGMEAGQRRLLEVADWFRPGKEGRIHTTRKLDGLPRGEHHVVDVLSRYSEIGTTTKEQSEYLLETLERGGAAKMSIRYYDTSKRSLGELTGADAIKDVKKRIKDIDSGERTSPGKDIPEDSVVLTPDGFVNLPSVAGGHQIALPDAIRMLSMDAGFVDTRESAIAWRGVVELADDVVDAEDVAQAWAQLDARWKEIVKEEKSIPQTFEGPMGKGSRAPAELGEDFPMSGEEEGEAAILDVFTRLDSEGQ